MSAVVRADGLPWPNGSPSFEFTTPLLLGDVLSYVDTGGRSMQCRIVEQRGDVWAAEVIEAGESSS